MSAFVRIVIAAACCVVAPFANAQWVPAWMTAWKTPEAVFGVRPFDVRVGADGAVFAVATYTQHSSGHVALARFDGDGRFAWLREEPAFDEDALGIELIGGNRVAIFGATSAGGALVIVRDGASGDLVWQQASADCALPLGLRGNVSDARILVEGADGTLSMRCIDATHGEYVVQRYTADGSALPEWRAQVGGGNTVATDIDALEDGGIVVTGYGDFLADGYRTVRFDATGRVLWTDFEPGDIGNPLGPARVRADAAGNILVAASPESSLGEPRAQVWKLAADGSRRWTTVLPNPGSMFAAIDIGYFLLAANGDAVVAVDAVSDGHSRLVRLHGADGAIAFDSGATAAGTPVALAEAPNGRLLVGGRVFLAGGESSARLLEFSSDGAACRGAEIGFSSVTVAGSANGWSALAPDAFSNAGNHLFAWRFDASAGDCEADALFSDGFDGS